MHYWYRDSIIVQPWIEHWTFKVPEIMISTTFWVNGERKTVDADPFLFHLGKTSMRTLPDSSNG